MSEKVLPVIDFDETIDTTEQNIKLFLALPGSSGAFAYTKPATVTVNACVEAARTAITTAGGKEFGALSEAIKFSRKKGNNHTNYKKSKLTEGSFVLKNCTVANYKASDELHNQTIDIYELDEANATLTIHSKLLIETEEDSENTKHKEIPYKATRDTTAVSARIFINLITGESTKITTP